MTPKIDKKVFVTPCRFNWRLFLIFLGLILAVMLARKVFADTSWFAATAEYILFSPIITINYFATGFPAEYSLEWTAWLQLLLYAFVFAIESGRKTKILLIIVGVHLLLACIWFLVILNIRG